jgi:sugar phosphate isomerase/epimerase
MAVEGLSINLATVREQYDIRQAVDACLAQGITAIAPWRDQVHAIGLGEAARIVADNGLHVTGLCRGGMFPAADRDKRNAAIDDNLRAIDEAAALNADCLVLVVGGLPAGSRDLPHAREMITEGIAAILPRAKACRMPLAIEPLHPMYAADRACVNTLEQALDLCDALDPMRTRALGVAQQDRAALGVAVDLYHVWWDPKLESQIARAGHDRLLAFHVCDWLVPTRDLLTDRGMMGDGVIDIPRVRGWVEATGYTGYSEVEIFSAENWWKRDAGEVLDTCIARHCSAV